MSNYFKDALLLLGRIAFALLFIPNGLRQLSEFSKFASSLGGHSFRFPGVVAALALIAEIMGPILILLGYEIWLGTLLLALFCMAASLTSHRYWDLPVAAQAAAMLQFYKNFALAGGLGFLFVSGPGRCSLEACVPGLWKLLHPTKL